MMNEDLRTRRERIGMTQKQLAKIMLVTERTIQRWESGETTELHPLLRNAWIQEIEQAEYEAEKL